MAFRCRNASRTNSSAAGSPQSAAAASSERHSAIASKSTEGVPASCPSASRVLSSERRTPLIFGETNLDVAPVAATALRRAAMLLESEPSATNRPIARLFQRVLLHFADDLQCKRGRQAFEGYRRLRGSGQRHPGSFGDGCSQMVVDRPDMAEHCDTYVRVLDLGEFEHERARMCACSTVWLRRTSAPGCSDRRSSPRGCDLRAVVRPGASGSRGALSRGRTGGQRVRLVARSGPVGRAICMWPSRWWFANGHFGALIGNCVEVRDRRGATAACRDRRSSRPCSSGSLVKSMPGTTLAVQNATCSVSAKKLSGLRSSTMRPIERAPAPAPRGSAWSRRA